MTNKNELREKAKAIRKLLDMESISKKVVSTLRETEIYEVAKNILIFYPLQDEINLLPLLKDSDKNFYLPKVSGDDLLVCPYKEGDKLALSSFNTQEPLTQPVDPNVLDMIFVPALIADRQFHRIGYGRGYYDRFLNKHALQAIRIVPVPSALVVDELPSDENDAQFDVILDEA